MAEGAEGRARARRGAIAVEGSLRAARPRQAEDSRPRSSGKKRRRRKKKSPQETCLPTHRGAAGWSVAPFPHLGAESRSSAWCRAAKGGRGGQALIPLYIHHPTLNPQSPLISGHAEPRPAPPSSDVAAGGLPGVPLSHRADRTGTASQACSAAFLLFNKKQNKKERGGGEINLKSWFDSEQIGVNRPGR